MDYEGTRLENTDYKLKKLRMSVQAKDAEIKDLKEHIEAITKKYEEKIDKLERSVAFWNKRYNGKIKPRSEIKTQVQGASWTTEEAPVSPSISDEGEKSNAPESN